MKAKPGPQIKFQVWDSHLHRTDVIAPILQESYGKRFSENWLDKKFQGTQRVVAAVGLHDERPVGIVAFGCVPLIWKGGQITGGFSYDTYVAPDFRGQGLFSQMLPIAEDAAASAGVRLLLNLPNASSKPGFLHAGWQELARGQENVRLCRVTPAAAKGLIHRAPFRPAHDSQIHADDLLRFEQLSTGNERLHSARTVEYLSERLDKHRGSGYFAVTTDAAVALVRVGHRGVVSETQLLALAPSILTTRQLRGVINEVRRTLDPELLTALTFGGGRGRLPLLKNFFATTRSKTILFGKVLTSGVALPSRNEIDLSGIDIHTW